MSQKNGDQLVKDIQDIITKISQGHRKKSGGQTSKDRKNHPGSKYNNDNSRKILYGIIALILASILVVDSIYTVDVSEEGVVTRLGRYTRTVNPGLHLKMPLGIEQVTRVKTKIVHQEEFGFRDPNRRRRVYTNNTNSTSLNNESLMLTGDLNVAYVEWILQYRIVDSWKYLFKARNVETNIRDVSISIMRRVVGDKLVNDVLTIGRVEIADEAKLLTQEVLDHYDMGIKVVRINLQDVNPPDPVKAAFNEVNAAKQEQEQTINQAEQEYNRRIPEALGKAEQTIRNAQGVSIDLINRSKGDSEKFNLIYTEYSKAPDITKKRMYLETMREVFQGNKGLTIIDKDVEGILPVFGPLNQNLSAELAGSSLVSSAKSKLSSDNN